MKVQTYLLSAALVASLGLNAAQLGAIGEAKAGITEPLLKCSPYLDTTPAALGSATLQQVASQGLNWLNGQYEPSEPWVLGDCVGPDKRCKLEQIIDPVYEDGAVARFCLRAEFTTVAGVPE